MLKFFSIYIMVLLSTPAFAGEVTNSGDCNVNLIGSGNTVRVICPDRGFDPLEAELSFVCQPLNKQEILSVRIVDFSHSSSISRRDARKFGRQLESYMNQIAESGSGPKINPNLFGSGYLDGEGNFYRRLTNGKFVAKRILDQRERDAERARYDVSELSISSILFLAYTSEPAMEDIPGVKGLSMGDNEAVLYLGLDGYLGGKVRMTMRVDVLQSQWVEARVEMRMATHTCESIF